MPKPRYDEDENVSRHAATSPKKCQDMEKKYGWKLKRVELTSDPTLEVDCVFEGKTAFPISYQNTDKEEKKDA